MPLTDRSQAKESGFAQVREALVSFKGDVESAEFGKWGGKLIDEEGNPVAPREFLEISNKAVEVLEVTEELSMPVDEWNFRVNCSDFKGSFWVESFLASADAYKIQIPEGLVKKRVTWKKVTQEAFDKTGNPVPKFNSTNFVIAGVEEVGAGRVVVPVVASPVVTPQVVAPSQPVTDPMELILALAIGKTENQFKTAVGLDPNFAGSPLLNLAKAGMLTQSLVNDGKLELVTEGNKQVYRVPG